jgi:haloalkane dehalogenase
MNFINTPEERFANLEDYAFKANYLEVEARMQLHYVDEGPKDAKETVLLLHGEPSWSYLYRKMIPVFANAGHRVIAPDLIGFGKSSKPTEMSAYTYQKHVQWMTEVLTQLDLNNITLFGQDWGGIIGLRLAVLEEDRFSRVAIGNTVFPMGVHDTSKMQAFLQWREYSQKVDKMNVGKVLQSSTESTLSQAVMDAYWAPFPEKEHMAGAKIFPSIVPLEMDNPECLLNKKLWKEKWMKWEKPFLTLFSDKDPMFSGQEGFYQKYIPGAKGQPHQVIKGGGHFLQEDKGEEMAHILIGWMG